MENKQNAQSGAPNYEQCAPESNATVSSSIETQFTNKITKSYRAEDIQKYQINKPTRDIIYAKIIRQVRPEKPCMTSEETKTTE